MAISLEEARLLIGKRILSENVAIPVGDRSTPPGTPWTLEAIDESGPTPVFKLALFTSVQKFQMDFSALEHFRSERLRKKGS